jgi:hypothetical protein
MHIIHAALYIVFATQLYTARQDRADGRTAQSNTSLEKFSVVNLHTPGPPTHGSRPRVLLAKCMDTDTE